MAESCQSPENHSKLCTFCQRLKNWKWQWNRGDPRDRYMEHRPTYSSLCTSASEGCQICSLLIKGLLLHKENRPPSIEVPPVEDDSKGSFCLCMKSGWVADKGTLCDGFTFGQGSKGRLHHPAPLFQILAPPGAFPELLRGRPQGSGPSLALARDWFDDCIENHPECASQKQDGYPTRLLHVRPSECGKSYNVSLVESNVSLDEPYIALSHCWGPIQPLRTLKQNYQAHMGGIPFKSLPKTFQDAVITTLSLSVNKLWIDSLCIIQDQSEDWELECPRMAAIYANSRCTIAACDAPGASLGFLNDYSPDLRCPLGNSALVRYFPNAKISAEVSDDEQTLLSQRGWVLQEKLLSPRTLAFKSERTQWQCKRHFKSDDVHFPYRFTNWHVHSATATFLTGHVEQLDVKALEKSWRTFEDGTMSGYSVWRDIVQTYSIRALTYGSDKLPALSGLARIFSARLRDTYMAGIWQHDMCSGLAWSPAVYPHRNDPEGSPSAPRLALSYRAPSWSWAAIDGELAFFPVAEEDLLFVSVDIQQKGLDPFGQVTRGVLNVNGRVKSTTLQGFKGLRSSIFGKSLQDASQGITKVLILLIGYSEKLWHSGHSDDDEDLDTDDQTGSEKEEDGLSYWSRSWYAIAVEKVASKNGDVHRRIDFVRSQESMGFETFSNCPRQNLALI